MSTVLSIENINKSFKNGQAVLSDISLTVNKGEAVVIIGSSGSGKSTLLRCVNGLERINSGKIVLNGEILVYTNQNETVIYPAEKDMRKICTNTAMVFQHFNLFPHLTCLENITISPVKILHQDKDTALNHGLELLENVGLLSKAKSYPDELSGGQKQRVAIARALAINPEIMLFDEPTSALDPEITVGVTNVILELVRQRITMVMVTHDMNFARLAASRIIFIDEGRIVEEGTPREIFENPKTARLKEFLSSFTLKA